MLAPDGLEAFFFKRCLPERLSGVPYEVIGRGRIARFDHEYNS
jgi:hypothetical protein